MDFDESPGMASWKNTSDFVSSSSTDDARNTRPTFSATASELNDASLVNAMTIDVEDYYQVSAF